MQELNWEAIWRQTYEQKRSVERKDPGIAYWDKRAADFSESRKTNDYEYGRKVLKALDGILNPDSEVLDVGAGPGTFVVPFAGKVKKITALEPAQEMTEIMKKNAAEKSVTNFEVMNALWQDVNISEIANRYDLVVSSLVLWMFEDIWSPIERMEQAAKGYCCIVTGAGGKDPDEEELWRAIMGEAQQPSYQEYPLISNLLYATERYPNVRMIRYTSERSLETAIRYRTLLYTKYVEMTPEIEEKIKQHVLAQAVDGKCQRESTSAVIWWDVRNAGREI